MGFIEAPAFTRYLSEYLTDDEYRRRSRTRRSDARKGRLPKAALERSQASQGRRSGLRIIYYFFVTDQQIWLMTLYDKDEAADLTPKEKKMLKDAIETELQARQAKRRLRGTKTGRTRNE